MGPVSRGLNGRGYLAKRTLPSELDVRMREPQELPQKQEPCATFQPCATDHWNLVRRRCLTHPQWDLESSPAALIHLGISHGAQQDQG